MGPYWFLIFDPLGASDYSSTIITVSGAHCDALQIGFTGPQAQDIGATVGFVRNQIGFTGPVSQQVSQ